MNKKKYKCNIIMDKNKNKNTPTKKTKTKIHSNLLIIIAIAFPIVTFGLLFFKSTRKIVLSIVSFFDSYSKKSNMGYLLFILFVIFTNVVFQESTLPNIIAGYIFGTKLGTLLTSCGCVLSSIITFYIGKYIIKKDVLSELESYKWFEDIYNIQDSFKSFDWFKLVALTRLGPNYPFHIISYLWGVTDIHIIIYILGTFIGSLPLTMFEAYVGSQLKKPKEIFHANNVKILIVFIIISVSLTFIIKNYLENISKKYTKKSR